MGLVTQRGKMGEKRQKLNLLSNEAIPYHLDRIATALEAGAKELESIRVVIDASLGSSEAMDPMDMAIARTVPSLWCGLFP